MNKKQIKTTFEAAHTRNDNIFVTRPVLPPLDEFIEYLREIWDRKWLTNNGLFHQRLEKELANFLGVKYISLFSNGTLALVTALQVLRITGEVITTPYSFVATTHALNWNGITPVFCDIEPKTMNLDAEKIEALITPETTAILPVHVYGNPCDVYKIEQIADIYGLKVIYDACHAFGVEFNNETILNFGDLSVLSFHATKIFTTMEGGALITSSEKMKRRIDFLKNFGFADEITVVAPGINGKMNEMQAALGLLQIQKVKGSIQRRKEITQLYRERLADLKGISILNKISGVKHNYAYFPIFIDEDVFGASRDEVYVELKRNHIYSRRYFYPLISEFPMYKHLPSANSGNLLVAERISQRVICLPIYPELQENDLDRIIYVIKNMQNG